MPYCRYGPTVVTTTRARSASSRMARASEESAAMSGQSAAPAPSSARTAASRETYERDVRGALEAMLEDLADELGGEVRLFRQHRDVRFSADKSPYKTTTYGIIAGRPESDAALYAQLSSAGLFAGTGYYRLDAGQLARLRDAIDDEASGVALQRAVDGVRAAGVEIHGDTLKTAPRGYPRDHPRVELLRH